MRPSNRSCWRAYSPRRRERERRRTSRNAGALCRSRRATAGRRGCRCRCTRPERDGGAEHPPANRRTPDPCANVRRRLRSARVQITCAGSGPAEERIGDGLDFGIAGFRVRQIHPGQLSDYPGNLARRKLLAATDGDGNQSVAVALRTQRWQSGWQSEADQRCGAGRRRPC